MAGPAPETKDWSARENEHQPEGVHLVVSGSVAVGATNKIAVLSETKGPGDVLMLDLEIETAGHEGADVMVWTPAVFHREVDEDQFQKVTVRWNTNEIATFPVIDDRQHAAVAATRHKAQNAAAGAASTAKKAGAAVKKAAAAPKTAAKKVAKKAAKVTTSAKKAAKSAKKAVKKTGRKVKKVVARPAPKKSALKRLVKKLVKKLSPRKSKKKGKR